MLSFSQTYITGINRARLELLSWWPCIFRWNNLGDGAILMGPSTKSFILSQFNDPVNPTCLERDLHIIECGEDSMNAYYKFISVLKEVGPRCVSSYTELLISKDLCINIPRCKDL